MLAVQYKCQLNATTHAQPCLSHCIYVREFNLAFDLTSGTVMTSMLQLCSVVPSPYLALVSLR